MAKVSGDCLDVGGIDSGLLFGCQGVPGLPGYQLPGFILRALSFC
jgi:hypothetical protein